MAAVLPGHSWGVQAFQLEGVVHIKLSAKEKAACCILGNVPVSHRAPAMPVRPLGHPQACPVLP